MNNPGAAFWELLPHRPQILAEHDDFVIQFHLGGSPEETIEVEEGLDGVEMSKAGQIFVVLFTSSNSFPASGGVPKGPSTLQLALIRHRR